MSAPTKDTLTKVSTDGELLVFSLLLPPSPLALANSLTAATEFVQSFYPALESSRESISTFYAPTISTILFNGNAVADGSSVQDIFVNKMPLAHYEVQSFDCQIINPSYPTATGVPTDSPTAVRNMSLLVTVSGYVKFGDHRETRDLPNRGFSETFILVPNPVKQGTSDRMEPRKHLVILNFSGMV